VDATVFLVPALRPALIQAIDRLERSANDQRHKAFSECSAEDREGLLREFEAVDASDAFNMVRDFTYEAYYGHSRVLAALEKETSWSSASPTRGSTIGFAGNYWRMAPSDFKVHTLDGVAADWPLTYDELAPYYTINERVIGVAGLANDPCGPPRDPLPVPPAPIGRPGELLADA